MVFPNIPAQVTCGRLNASSFLNHDVSGWGTMPQTQDNGRDGVCVVLRHRTRQMTLFVPTGRAGDIKFFKRSGRGRQDAMVQASTRPLFSEKAGRVER